MRKPALDSRQLIQHIEAMASLSVAEQKSYLSKATLSAPEKTKLAEILKNKASPHSLFDHPLPERIALNWEQQENAWLGKTFQDYKAVRPLPHHGTFLLFEAHHITDQRKKAIVKILPKSVPQHVLRQFIQEQTLLFELNHPNIIAPIATAFTPCEQPYILMHKIPGSDLITHCTSQHSSPSERILLFLSICEAVDFCHERGIYHHDIKPANIIVSMQSNCPRPILLDFGIAQRRQKNQKNTDTFSAGTPYFMSPESLHQEAPLDEKRDIYALGKLLLLLFHFETEHTRPAPATSLNSATIRSHEYIAPTLLRNSLSQTQQSQQASKMRLSVAELNTWITPLFDHIILKTTATLAKDRYSNVKELMKEVNTFLACTLRRQSEIGQRRT